MDFSKKLRGQAFETMMLVISVIVALAILAVLLNVLNIVKPPGGDPVSTMHNDLQSIQSTGFGITAPKQITLTQSQVVLRNSVIQSIPIQTNQLGFFVYNDFGSGSSGQNSGPFTTSGTCTAAGSGSGSAPCVTSVQVNQNIQVYEVACGNTNQQSGSQGSWAVQYCIALAETGQHATTACQAGCNVQ